MVTEKECLNAIKYLKGNQAKENLNLSFESALTYGDWDINENWWKYKEDFLKGGNNE